MPRGTDGARARYQLTLRPTGVPAPWRPADPQPSSPPVAAALFPQLRGGTDRRGWVPGPEEATGCGGSRKQSASRNHSDRGTVLLPGQSGSGAPRRAEVTRKGLSVGPSASRWGLSFPIWRMEPIFERPDAGGSWGHEDAEARRLPQAGAATRLGCADPGGQARPPVSPSPPTTRASGSGLPSVATMAGADRSSSPGPSIHPKPPPPSPDL